VDVLATTTTLTGVDSGIDDQIRANTLFGVEIAGIEEPAD